MFVDIENGADQVGCGLAPASSACASLTFALVQQAGRQHVDLSVARGTYAEPGLLVQGIQSFSLRGAGPAETFLSPTNLTSAVIVLNVTDVALSGFSVHDAIALESPLVVSATTALNVSKVACARMRATWDVHLHAGSPSVLLTQEPDPAIPVAACLTVCDVASLMVDDLLAEDCEVDHKVSAAALAVCATRPFPHITSLQVRVFVWEERATHQLVVHHRSTKEDLTPPAAFLAWKARRRTSPV